MRVGVDATSWPNRRGYGRFARNALGRLVELDLETDYVFFVGAGADATSIPDRSERRTVAVRGTAEGGAGRPLVEIVRLTATTSRSGLDAFLFPSLYTYFPVLRTPTVVGIHDTTPSAFPELTLPSRRARLAWRVKERLAVRSAARLFTVSEASRAAIVERFGLSPADVAVVPEAPEAAFSPRAREEVTGALDSIGLDTGRPFFVYAAGISPHKNLETLLDAYAALRAARPDPPPALVLAGELAGDPYLSAAGAVRARVQSLGLDGDVVFPGFVPDDVLACLYSGAAAAVVTSLSEGFGLPAVEAAACGAPVVLSDLPAHRESLGTAALYFPAVDAAALRTQLERLLDDAAFGRSLGEEGRRTVGLLSWDAAAERLAELVREAASGRRRRG